MYEYCYLCHGLLQLLLTVKPKHRLGRELCFYSKTDFWPSYCQISTDFDKILHTPIYVPKSLVSQLRLRSVHGWLQTKPKRLFFVILVMYPKSYIETMDRRDFCGKLSEWR